MKILLAAINAKYIHSNLAVYSLRASAGDYKESVELAEYTINNRKDAILEDIFKRRPDVLCFSCYIWNVEYVVSIAREFHKICPEVPVWAGGPEVSYETESFLKKQEAFRGIMIGEGEDTFRELCGYYDSLYGDGGNSCDRKPALGDEELGKIAGLAFRDLGGKIVWTEKRDVTDLTSLPFCYEESEDFENRIIYYESSRGCPFSCSYCLSSVDKKLRFRDIELVKKDLRFFLNRRVAQVKFVDRTFNCLHEHAMAIWRFIKENDNGITNFHFEISADLITEEELDLISDMRPGLIQLEIGVQSVNEVTIKEIHRTMKLERLKEVVRKVRAGGNIHQHLDLIAGLPYEGYESFRHSFDDIFALWPNQLQLGFLKVLKGSYMYEHAGEYGILYHDEPPYEVLSTNWLSFEEVLKIKQVEELLEVYYNSGQFEMTMKMLGVMNSSMFDFFQDFGAFYEKKGYFQCSHSRLRRCEILLEYLAESPHLELMKEALIFDLYYRENCKTRPSWAPDMATFRDMTHQYCKNGKLSHVEPFHYRFPQKEEYALQEIPARVKNCLWVRFDYERRDPLDNQAYWEYLE